MSNFLEKLHEKPREIRKTVAVSTTSVITLLIVIVWVSVTDFSLRPDTHIITTDETINESQVASPLAGIKSDIAALKDNVKELIRVSRDSTNEITGELEIVETPNIPVTPSDIGFSFEETDDDGGLEVIEVRGTTTYPY